MIDSKILKARLGVFDKEYQTQNESSGTQDNDMRLQFNGGDLQQQRMVRDKQRSLDRALWYSYQAAQVRNTKGEEVVKALINPNKLNSDYDEKVISVHFIHNFAVGDTFEWMGTGTYWLIYLQELSEIAYFKARIRRCSYEIQWDDGEKTHVAIKGPDQTTINSQKIHSEIIDNPNYRISLLVPKTEETLKQFARYKKFYLGGFDEEKKVCWRVEAVDYISTPGIIEVSAVEYYSNTFEDDVENGVVGGLIEEPQDPNPLGDPINGETFIKPKMSYTYTYTGSETGEWTYNGKLPIAVSKKEGKTITIIWNSSYSGQFEIKYGSATKTIVVQSLF